MPQVCKGCGADIIWIKTQSGKSMPVDAKPISGYPAPLLSTVLVHEMVKIHMSHFATCPKADKFRKRGHKRFAEGGGG